MKTENTLTELQLTALKDCLLADGRLSEFLAANPEISREQVFTHLTSKFSTNLLPDCEERWWA